MSLSHIPLHSELDDDSGFRAGPRPPREGAGRGGRYRRGGSPPLDDDRDAHRNSLSDMAMQDAAIAAARSRGLPATNGVPDQQRGKYPPTGNNTGVARQVAPRGYPPPQGQPPSYPGPSPPDVFQDSGAEAGAGGPPTRRAARHARRASVSAERPPPPIDPSLLGPPNGPGLQPRGPPPSSGGYPGGPGPQQDGPRGPARQSRSPPKGGPGPADSSSLAPADPGPDRLASPSIGKSVLLPLERKVREYQGLMDDAQREMEQLDDELRALEERRRAAEDRFVEAKSKHDEYERRYGDVDRALRGEGPPPHQGQPPQRQVAPSPSWVSGAGGPDGRPGSVMSYDEDERPMSGRSEATSRMKGKSRFRLSLFKG